MPSDHAIPLSSPAQSQQQRRIIADATLVLASLVWGSTFVLVKDAVAVVPPLVFLSARFAFGAAALWLIVLVMGRVRGLTWREVRWGALMGAFLWAGYSLQTVGLQWTTASNAGFITGLYVVIVPVLGVFFLRHAPGRWAWLGVVAATAGLLLLSVRFDQGLSINEGDPLELGCAIAFALQIIVVAHVAPTSDPFRLTAVQVLFCGLLTALSAGMFEQPTPVTNPGLWVSAAFMGIVATGLGIIAQVSAQRFTSHVHAVLIFTLEPVFAAFFGVWLQNDRLEVAGYTGAALILGGMVVAELGPWLGRRRSRRRAVGLATGEAEFAGSVLKAVERDAL